MRGLAQYCQCTCENFSHTVVLLGSSPPFGYIYMALSHLACIPMPFHSFVLQLPSPPCCVWCQLDKFSFFFSPFHLEPLQDSVDCNIAVTTTNPCHCHLNTTTTSPVP